MKAVTYDDRQKWPSICVWQMSNKRLSKTAAKSSGEFTCIPKKLIFSTLLSNEHLFLIISMSQIEQYLEFLTDKVSQRSFQKKLTINSYFPTQECGIDLEQLSNSM